MFLAGSCWIRSNCTALPGRLPYTFLCPQPPCPYPPTQGNCVFSRYLSSHISFCFASVLISRQLPCTNCHSRLPQRGMPWNSDYVLPKPGHSSSCCFVLALVAFSGEDVFWCCFLNSCRLPSRGGVGFGHYRKVVNFGLVCLMGVFV